MLGAGRRAGRRAGVWFDNTTSGLASGNGRVLVGHGADPVGGPLDPVDIVAVSSGAGGAGGSGGAGAGGAAGSGTGDCTPVIEDLEFATQTPREGESPLDLPAGPVTIAFDLGATETCPDTFAIEVPVTAGVVSILVAVDEDTGDGLAPELWAIVDASNMPLRLINPQPAPASP